MKWEDKVLNWSRVESFTHYVKDDSEYLELIEATARNPQAVIDQFNLLPDTVINFLRFTGDRFKYKIYYPTQVEEIVTGKCEDLTGSNIYAVYFDHTPEYAPFNMIIRRMLSRFGEEGKIYIQEQ